MIGSLRFLGNREFVPRDKFTDFQAQQLCFSLNLLQQNRQLLVGTLIQERNCELNVSADEQIFSTQKFFFEKLIWTRPNNLLTTNIIAKTSFNIAITYYSSKVQTTRLVCVLLK